MPFINRDSCIVNKAISHNKIGYCEGLMDASEIVSDENYGGREKFMDCTQKFIAAKNTDASACSGFKSVHEYMFEYLCLKSYLKTGKILSCKEIETMSRAIKDLNSSDTDGQKQSLTYFKNLCPTSSAAYQMECTYTKYGFVFSFCQPYSEYYAEYKERCAEYKKLFNEFCTNVPLNTNEAKRLGIPLD